MQAAKGGAGVGEVDDVADSSFHADPSVHADAAKTNVTVPFGGYVFKFEVCPGGFVGDFRSHSSCPKYNAGRPSDPERRKAEMEAFRSLFAAPAAAVPAAAVRAPKRRRTGRDLALEHVAALLQADE